jgi:hypothetical protein
MARIRRMVPVPRRCLSPASSPWMRRCPQDGFSCAKLQHEVTDLVADGRATGRVRVGPFFRDQAAVPGQQCAGSDDAVQTQPLGEQAGQGGQDRSIWPGGSRPGHLTAKHRDFVAQDQGLDVLGPSFAGEQPEPAEHRARDQIQQSKQHGL